MVLNKLKKAAALVCALAVLIFCFGGTKVSAMFSSSYTDTGDIEVLIDTASGRIPISPYIYGISSETSLSGLSVNAIKQSDPRMSSYNWETNFSNSAEGAVSSNDNALVKSYPLERQGEPALYTDNLVTKAKRYGIASRYVTLQMMGYAAADGDGAVYDTDISSRWDKVFFRKRDDFLSAPDAYDGAVYMDEYVSFLVNKYGYAMDGGINGYFLDYEPENWSELYPAAAAEPITADELISRSAELAQSVKETDPTALVYGPSINGIEAFINLKNPSDWENHGQQYSWFIDYYLEGMSKASEAAGTRLLDVLDIHYHTEATNGLLEPVIDGTDNFSNNTRMQAPRILWDSTYTENSTIAIMHNQHIPLIPTLEASVDMYYPGTKISFSEYNFGGGGHISGGIAVADALGIFASYGVHMACLKPNSEDTSYQKSGINIYTNYDGSGGKFGDTLVASDNGGDVMSSVYASVSGRNDTSLKVLLINKNVGTVKTADVRINSDAVFESAEVYSFNGESPEIVLSEEEITVEDNGFVFDMEPLTVYMLVFSGTEEQISAEVTDDSVTVTDTGISESSGEQSSDGTVSDSGAVTESAAAETSATPEHVSAETLSSAGTATDSAGEAYGTSPGGTETSANDGISDSESASDGEEEAEEKEEKSVPKAVKIIVAALVAGVVIAMAYVIVQDRLLSKKK